MRWITRKIVSTLLMLPLLMLSIAFVEMKHPRQAGSAPRFIDQALYHPIGNALGYSPKQVDSAKEELLVQLMGRKRFCLDGSIAPDEWTQKVRNQKLSSEHWGNVGTTTLNFTSP